MIVIYATKLLEFVLRKARLRHVLPAPQAVLLRLKSPALTGEKLLEANKIPRAHFSAAHSPAEKYLPKCYTEKNVVRYSYPQY
jgi:hypothetical protein